MVEHGNDMHRNILTDTTQLDPGLQAWTDRLFQDNCSSIPPKNLRETTKNNHSDSEDESDDCMTDPTTGGCIHLQDAVTVVYRIAASARGSNYRISDDRFFEFAESCCTPNTSQAYTCTIHFPFGVAISKVTGPSCATIAQARRTACYQACLELLDLNQLDYRLFPLPINTRKTKIGESISPRVAEALPTKQIPTDSDHQQVQAEPKAQTTQPYLRKQPEFWNFTSRINSGILYPVIVSFNNSADATKAYGPMLILTRYPLPPLSSFNVFFSGTPATVNIIQAASFEASEEQLKDLHGYTIRVCRAIMNKSFTCDSEKMLYFLAPVSSNWEVQKINQYKGRGFPDAAEHIPWELVKLAAESWAVPLASCNTRTMAKDMEDAIVQDRWVEFTRRYEVVCIRHDLTPLSKPEDSNVGSI